MTQSVMRSICDGREYRDQLKSLTTRERWTDEHNGWKYHVRSRRAFGRLLLQVEGNIVIEGHSPPLEKLLGRLAQSCLTVFHGASAGNFIPGIKHCSYIMLNARYLVVISRRALYSALYIRNRLTFCPVGTVGVHAHVKCVAQSVILI